MLDFLEHLKDSLIDGESRPTVVMDNLPTHWTIENLRWLEANGFKAQNIPSYSPEVRHSFIASY